MKEVLSSILESPSEMTQLEQFFEAFVEVTKEVGGFGLNVALASKVSGQAYYARNDTCCSEMALSYLPSKTLPTSKTRPSETQC